MIKKLFASPAIIQSASIYTLSTLINSLVRFAVLTIGARVLDLEDFGALDMIFFVALIFSSLIVMGSDSAVLRFMFNGEKNDQYAKRVLTSGLTLTITSSIILIILFNLSFLIIDYSSLLLSNKTLINCIALFGVGFSIMAVNGAHMRAQFEEKRFFIATITSALIRIVPLALFFFIGKTNLTTFLYIVSVTYFTSGIIFLALNYRWISFYSMDSTLICKMCKFGFPLGGIVVTASFYPFLERFIILYNYDNVWLSIYAASAFPAMFLSVATQVVNSAWVPYALKVRNHKNSSFIQHSAVILHIFSVLLYFFLLILSETIVQTLIPISIENPARLFPFIGMIFLVRFSSIFTSFGLIFSKRTDIKFIINTCGFISSVAAAFIASKYHTIEVIPIIFFLVSYFIYLIEAIFSYRSTPEITVPYSFMVINIGIIGLTVFFIEMVN